MVSSKSTCGSRKNELNRTLSSMNIDEDYAIRISFDYTNTKEEIKYTVLKLPVILELKKYTKTRVLWLRHLNLARMV